MGKTLASLEDVKFEDEFFNYNSDEDSDGGIGIELIDRAIYRAKLAEISLTEWVIIHKLYYQMRKDSKRLK
jgi:hypothetical protein